MTYLLQYIFERVAGWARGRGRASSQGIQHPRLGLIPWSDVVAISWDGTPSSTEVVALVRGVKDPVGVARGARGWSVDGTMRRTTEAIERVAAECGLPDTVELLAPTGLSAGTFRNAKFAATMWWPWDPRSRSAP